MKKYIFRLLTLLVSLALPLLLLFLFKPEWLIAIVTSADSPVLFWVDTEEPLVALTIDDGPDATTTGKLLDILDKNHAQATFFILSSHVPGNEPLVEQMVAEGHELGNHTVYDEAAITLDEVEFEEKFLEADKVLSQYATTRWFRPGWGLYDTELVEFVEAHGYKTALGAVHPLDPQIPSAEFAAWYVLHHVEPGSIIMLHDCGGRGERTAEVLEEVLPELTLRDYKVVTLTELFELDQD